MYLCGTAPTLLSAAQVRAAFSGLVLVMPLAVLDSTIVSTALPTIVGVFLIAMGVAPLGFVLVWLMPEQPLRKTVAAVAGDAGADSAGAFARPQSADSATEFLRGLSVLAKRDVQRRFIEGIVARRALRSWPADASSLAAADHRSPRNHPARE